MRLILPSFIILAVVFYEMSGGADFRSPEPPAPVLAEARETQQPIRIAPVQTTATTTKAPKVEKVAAGPVTETVAKPVETEDSPATGAEIAEVRASLTQGLSLLPDSGGSDPLQLVSLELGSSGLRQAAPKPDRETVEEQPSATLTEPDRDLREIIGTRVNMRDGPGTIYPVVARLNIGQSVEVLSESGTGWLRLRTLPEQQLGWISASLVSKADR